MTAHIEKVRERGENFSQNLLNKNYLFWSGKEENFTLSPIYDEYEELFSSETFHMVRGEIERSKEKEEKRRLNYLLEFIGFHIIRKQTQRLRDRISAFEIGSRIKFEEEEVPFHDSLWYLSNVEARSKREKIDGDRREIISQMNPILKEIYHKKGESVEFLGFSSYPEMFCQLYGIDLRGLTKISKEILRETEDVYKEFLAFFLRRNLGIKLEQAKKYDLLHLLRALDYDSYFNIVDMVEKVRKCMEEMGLDIIGDGRISLDMKRGQNKRIALRNKLYYSTGPEISCIPVLIPKKIMLVGMLRPGKENYQAFLHELGYSLRYCHMNEELPFELKRLGDSSVSEAFAFTWDELPLDKKWLEKYLGFTKDLDFIRFCYLVKLYYLRRYAAKFYYEVLLFEDDLLEGKEEVYKAFLTEATMVEYDKEDYLYDAEDDFYSGEYIRGCILQGQIIYYLRDHYDEEWFRREVSANFLKELWKKGGKLTAEELSKQLGYSDFDIKPMLDIIFENLA